MSWFGWGVKTYDEHVDRYPGGRHVVTDDGDHLVWYRHHAGVAVELMAFLDGEVVSCEGDSAPHAASCPLDLVREVYGGVDPFDDAMDPRLDPLAEHDEEIRFVRAWLAAGNRLARRST